jgi:hypothetical protein
LNEWLDELTESLFGYQSEESGFALLSGSVCFQPIKSRGRKILAISNSKEQESSAERTSAGNNWFLRPSDINQMMERPFPKPGLFVASFQLNI